LAAVVDESAAREADLLEQARLRAEDVSVLTANLATEKSEREESISTLTTRIEDGLAEDSSERREDFDILWSSMVEERKQMHSEIAGLGGRIRVAAVRVADEERNRKDADHRINYAWQKKVRDGLLEEEGKRLAAAAKAKTASDTAIQTAVSKEEQDRKEAVKASDEKIDDVTTSLATERKRRKEDDGYLKRDLQEEVRVRKEETKRIGSVADKAAADLKSQVADRVQDRRTQRPACRETCSGQASCRG